jgi:hypothetical protein
MYTYQTDTDDGDTYYSLWRKDTRIGEVWTQADAKLIIDALNTGEKKDTLTVEGILSKLACVEPHDPHLYAEDLNKLIHACRMSQEVDTTRQTRRLLMSFLTARLNAYTTEIRQASQNDVVSANGGLRILITISFIMKPGIINGLSRTHIPVNGLWSLDAQQYWAGLHEK